MIKKLLFLCFTLLISHSLLAQIVAGQVDDFQDGTTQGWRHQIVNPNDPFNVPNEGPNGAGDNIVRNSNSGGGGAGSRHLMFNTESRWTGDFTSQGIVAIRMNVRNSGANDLHLRLAMRGGAFSTWIASANAVVVPVGSGWTTINLSTDPSDFIVSQGGGDTPAEVLQDVLIFRIISNDGNDTSTQAAPHKGDLRVQISDYDSITPTTTLSAPAVRQDKGFQIYPNPSTNRLNISLANNTLDGHVEVYDVLGKRVHKQELNALDTSINVSRWNSGVYLVKVTQNSTTQTKRFVKQ